MLEHFYVDEKDRSHRIWQRDTLAVRILSREMLEQKLDYIHANPLQSHWNLVNNQEDYYYSSARFYLKQETDFRFLIHYKERF